MAAAIIVSGPCGAGKSTVARELSRLLGCPVIEVDDVKVERYGTTAMSSPDDFREAGRRAKSALSDHDSVVVVEAFLGDEWVELVRQELPDGTSIEHFYLWCDESTAMQRKRSELSENEIRLQFRREPPEHYAGRTSIDTRARVASDIANEIALLMQG